MRLESLISATEILHQSLRFIPSGESNDESCTSLACINASLSFPGKVFKEKKDLVMLLRLLLTLANHLVRKGESIDYPFASLLPALFYRTDYPEIPDIFPDHYFPQQIVRARKRASVLHWRVGKHELAVRVLELCISCYELKVGSNLVFQICGVMIPKLVKNIDKTGLSDEVKLSILQGIR